MKLQSLLTIFLALPVLASARGEVSFNVGELAEKAVLSKVLGGSDAGWFLPFHFNVTFNISATSTLSTDLVFRSDNHGTFTDYKEYLLLVGLEREVSDGLLGSIKIGGGHVAGHRSPSYFFADGTPYDSGEELLLYTCPELAAQASLYQKFRMGDRWTSSFGAELLVVRGLGCKNTPSWSAIGYLVHRYIPILKWNIGYVF
jgi:hypothetical protein